MMNLRDFYILGMPIETEIGDCHFIKVKEYPDLFLDLQVLSLTKNHLISKYTELNQKEKNPILDSLIEEMGKADLYTIANWIPDLQGAYIRVFSKVFNNEEILLSINEDNFNAIRKLIMDMNWIKEEKVNPNPEIQKAIERSKRVKSSDGDALEFSDVVSSVVGYNGLSYQDINEFTVYQLYMTFYRIAHIKNYDTSTLFATVASEAVKITNWSKHIDLNEEDNHSITKEELSQKSKELFGQ